MMKLTKSHLKQIIKEELQGEAQKRGTDEEVWALIEPFLNRLDGLLAVMTGLKKRGDAGDWKTFSRAHGRAWQKFENALTKIRRRDVLGMWGRILSSTGRPNRPPYSQPRHQGHSGRLSKDLGLLPALLEPTGFVTGPVGGIARNLVQKAFKKGAGSAGALAGAELYESQLKQIIKEELALVLELGFGEGKPASDKWSKKQEIVLEEEELEEVYSEKQRRWACSNPHELTAAQAREMCGSTKLKKKKSEK